MPDPIKVGFYAPMKSVDHEIVSGDRQVARYFVDALKLANYQVEIISDLRVYLGETGDQSIESLQNLAEAEIKRLKHLWSKESCPDIFFTYHIYHKSLDFIACVLSDYFNKPYIIAEASYAAKHRSGKYSEALRISADNIVRADLLIEMNPDDHGGIINLCEQRGVDSNIVAFKPFANFCEICADDSVIDIPQSWSNDYIFITHAMMRPGDKLKSYQLLSESLRLLKSHTNWRLVIIGCGSAESEVRQAFSEFGDKIYFCGLLSPYAIGAWLRRADIYLWPAINEAYGLSLLEALACGLPIISAQRSGVASIVDHQQGGLLCTEGDAQAFASSIETILNDKNFIEKARKHNLKKAKNQHSIEQAASSLKHHISTLINNR